MRLPPELLNGIFKHMADDSSGPDIETMKACCLTSSAIATLCEPHLYSCMIFCIRNTAHPRLNHTPSQPDPYYSQCQISIESFNRLQLRKPQIVKYVRRVGVVILHSKPWDQNNRWWKSVEQALLQLQHDKIQWLKVYTSIMGMLYIENATILKPIAKILQSPVLDTLHLYNVYEFPFHLIHSQPRLSRLRELDLGDVRISSPNAGSFTFPLHLDSVNLRWGSQQDMITLASINQQVKAKPLLDLSSLSSFSFHLTRTYRDRDVELAVGILGRTSNLKNLAIQSTDNVFEVQGSNTLSSAVGMHKETLQTLLLIWRLFPMTSLLSEIPEFLGFSDSPSFSMLERVCLQILFPCLESEDLWDEAEWDRLGEALSRFSALRVLELWIGPDHSAVYGLEPHAERYFEAGKKVIEKWLNSSDISVQTSFGNYMELPHEIVDLVLDSLSNDPSGPDIGAIKAFSLTSSTIYAICGPHLYSSVYFCLHSALYPLQKEYYKSDIYYPRCEFSVARFRQIQRRKPWINRCVKRLGIAIFDERQWLKHRRWWSDLEKILNKLQHGKIEWFKLDTNSYGETQTSPSALSGPISKILKSPVLSTLHLHCTRNFPFYHLFTGPSNIRHLDIRNTHVDSGQSDSSAVTFKWPIKLDSLTLRWAYQQKILYIGGRDRHGFSFIELLVDVSSLSSFAIRIAHGDKEQDIAFTCFILDRTRNLQKLELHSSNQTSSSKTLSPAIEKQSATLHTLTLSWRYNSQGLGEGPELLQIGPKLSNLRNIQLQILLLIRLSVTRRPEWNEDTWERLASSLSRFPALRSLEFCMGTEMSESEYMQTLVEARGG
ncbi:hypothetical protein CVT24_009122 [Panaeolus cyanescens]|uniref:F-box domain-containing protein n=1 Tax=Panaeolus cyanescens TaxID=181874 RepID=A0A409VEQ9_9AGAR|nr:hypothetical protein CVT24_009122 [Panaeolus cyanescens]